jgi:MoaA/NifB/PqqE/SkfB family radical SAM enzyme
MTLRRCVVGFVYNEPCPLKCDFCCHTKENVGPGKLTPIKVVPLVLDFAAQPAVGRFAFTGGDPFVYYTDIVSIMTSVRARGVSQPFHIVTSGFWGKSDAVVDRKLGTLRDLGMDMLYVSHDLEHAKWVSKETVYRIEKFCEKYGITFSVYGVFWESGTTVRDLLPNLRTRYTNEISVAPIGRARDQLERIRRDGPLESKISCGRPLNYDLTIYPNGEIYPCCSGGFNKEANLLLGNAFETPAKEILRRCFSDFYVIIAKELGFDKLLQRLSSHPNFQAITRFDEISTVCEMCKSIRGNVDLYKSIQAELQSMEIEYCIEGLNAILPEEKANGTSDGRQERHD